MKLGPLDQIICPSPYTRIHFYSIIHIFLVRLFWDMVSLCQTGSTGTVKAEAIIGISSSFLLEARFSTTLHLSTLFHNNFSNIAIPYSYSAFVIACQKTLNQKEHRDCHRCNTHEDFTYPTCWGTPPLSTQTGGETQDKERTHWLFLCKGWT